MVCNEAHRFLVAEQLRAAGRKPQAIILEPVGRNTAPAIALAALQAAPDALLLVLPADHVIRDVPAFQAAVRAAVPAAQAGKLVTFGIVPTAPETGYGYIKQAAARPQRRRLRHRRASSRSPMLARGAAVPAEAGGYCWNSGMFLFKASRYLEELRAPRAGHRAAAARRACGSAA